VTEDEANRFVALTIAECNEVIEAVNRRQQETAELNHRLAEVLNRSIRLHRMHLKGLERHAAALGVSTVAGSVWAGVKSASESAGC